MCKTLSRITRIGLIAISLGIVVFLWTSGGLADDHRAARGWFEKREKHLSSSFGRDDEGNETAGQVAAWLLAAANLPVTVSVLIKRINRVQSLGSGLKNALMRFNRYQKNHLMRFHYVVNPLVLGVAFWHWLSSRCRSTVLPEWGLIVLVALVVLGLIVKFKLCPPMLRKSIYRLHTQPLVLLTMLTVLTIGHLLID